MIAIPNMEVPKSCEGCQFLSLDGVVTDDNEWVSYEICEVTEQLIKEDITCPLIEIDDTVWENEKYKLIRMTQAVRINKEMAERRADEHYT